MSSRGLTHELVLQTWVGQGLTWFRLKHLARKRGRPDVCHQSSGCFYPSAVRGRELPLRKDVFLFLDGSTVHQPNYGGIIAIYLPSLSTWPREDRWFRGRTSGLDRISNGEHVHRRFMRVSLCIASRKRKCKCKCKFSVQRSLAGQ